MNDFRIYAGIFIENPTGSPGDAYVSFAGGPMPKVELAALLLAQYEECIDSVVQVIPSFVRVDQEILDSYYEWRLARESQEAESSA